MTKTLCLLSRIVPCRLAVRGFALTDVGRQRSRNEDSVLAMPESGVFAVADGMGGASGGEIASGLVTESLGEVAEKGCRPAAIASALQSVNSQIYEQSREHDAQGMGTTIVALHVDMRQGQGTVLHAGDSRLYRYRRGVLTQLTEDHSVLAEVKKRMRSDAGSEDLPSISLIEGQLTRAVGLGADLSLSRQTMDIKVGDIFLLCSDGLSKHVDDKQITDILSYSEREAGLEELAEELVNAANEGGGTDNISVVLVKLIKSPTFVKKLCFMLASAAIFVIAAIGLLARHVQQAHQKAARVLREQKSEMNIFLETEIFLTDAELHDLKEFHSKLAGMPGEEYEELTERLKRRCEAFLNLYREEAKKAISELDWLLLDSLIELDTTSFPLEVDAQGKDTIDFSQKKKDLPQLWWSLCESIQGHRFEDISRLSRQYAAITGLVGLDGPVRKIAELDFTHGSDLENAKLLFKEWPFDESQNQLRDSVEEFISRQKDSPGSKAPSNVRLRSQ